MVSNNLEDHYTDDFYTLISGWSKKSARVIVPIIMDLLHPNSAIDVGCGNGTWLSVFAEQGISDFYGLDGSYVNREKLQIPEDRFLPYDLNNLIQMNRRFDVAICLEVAEHLHKESSETIVKSLVNLSDTIVFSAAIPYQIGENHLNNQWPEFWISLFAKYGYKFINSLRYIIWNNPDVSFFYKQNILLFVKNEIFESSELLRNEFEKYKSLPISIVHPDLITLLGDQIKKLSIEKKFVDILIYRMKRRLKKIFCHGNLYKNLQKLR